MTRLVSVLAVGAALGCSAAPAPPAPLPPPVPVVSALPSASASAVEAPKPVERRIGNIPADSPAIGSMMPSRLTPIIAELVASLPKEYGEGIERTANLPPGALTSGALAGALGIDPDRPILFALAPLDAPRRAVVDAIKDRAVRPARNHSGAAKALDKLMYGARGGGVHFRMVVPTANPTTFIDMLGTLISFEGSYKKVDSPPAGTTAIYSREEEVIVVTTGAGITVVDYLIMVGQVPGSKMLLEAAPAAVRALDEAPPATVVPLGTDAGRFVWSPRKVAEVGVLYQANNVYDNVRQMRGGPERQRDSIAGQGMNEAHAAVDAAVRGNDAYLDSVELTWKVDGGFPTIQTRLRLGNAMRQSTEQEWTPSVSVDFPGALARFDIATACMKSFAVPGDVPNGPLEHGGFRGLLSDARNFKLISLLPLLPLGGTRVPLQWNAGVGPKAMQRFERFGWSNPKFGAPDVFWGLLPANANAESVACSVDESGAGCKGRRRLNPQGFNDVGGAFVRVVKLGDRWVVIASRDRAAVMAMKPVLTSSPVPPLRGAISSGWIQHYLADHNMKHAPFRMVGDVTRAGQDLTVTARPVMGP